MSKHLLGQAKTDGKQTEVGFTLQEILLPSPEDLAKFKEIEPSIIQWLMQHASKEQDSRIKLDQEELSAAIKLDTERNSMRKTEIGIVKTSLWLAFFIAVLFIALSGTLIFFGQEITGTIFGGLALVMCVQAFLKFGRNQKQ